MLISKVFSELGLCDIDQNYNWTGDVRQHYPNLDLANISNFIQQAQKLDVINDETY